MISYTAAFLAALAVSAILTPLIRNLSYRLKLYDTPDERKVHSRAVPRTGGVAILVAFLVPVLGIAMTRAEVGSIVWGNLQYMVAIVVGAVFIMLVGLMDDLRGLGAKKKFLLQALIATFAFALGFKIQYISLPFASSLPMGVFSYVVTVVWIVGIINAVNLIDGLDGLAGGIAFFVLIFNFILGYTDHSIMLCLVAAALAGAILGFLFYNFNPASIFMGDAGSMFIGYVLALGAISSGQKSSTTVALLTPIVAMGIPIMDTLFSMMRRFLERRSMFAPDKGHIHHRLLAMGLTHRRAVVVLYGFTVVLVCVALVIHISRDWQLGVGLLLLVLTFAVFARMVGVVDYFNRRRLSRIGIRTARAERLRKHVYEALTRASTIEDESQLPVYLDWLGLAGDFRFIDVHLSGAAEPVCNWESGEDDVDRRKRTLIAVVPVFDADGQEFANLRFGWITERGKVTSETEILLQIIADQLAPSLSGLPKA